jgi:hypothetical protein
VKIVSEQEINRAVAMSDLFGGIVCAALTGVALAAWWYLCLGLGVG